jgi:hypothetical protein
VDIHIQRKGGWEMIYYGWKLRKLKRKFSLAFYEYHFEHESVNFAKKPTIFAPENYWLSSILFYTMLMSCDYPNSNFV